MVEDRQARVARFDGIFAAHFDAVRAYAWRLEAAGRRRHRGGDVRHSLAAPGGRADEALPWLFAVARHVLQNLQRAERRRSPASGAAPARRRGASAMRRGRWAENVVSSVWAPRCGACPSATGEDPAAGGLGAARQGRIGGRRSTAPRPPPRVRLFRARKRLEAAAARRRVAAVTVPADVRGRLLDEADVLSMLRAADPVGAMRRPWRPAIASGCCRAIAAQQTPRRGLWRRRPRRRLVAAAAMIAVLVLLAVSSVWAASLLLQPIARGPRPPESATQYRAEYEAWTKKIPLPAGAHWLACPWYPGDGSTPRPARDIAMRWTRLWASGRGSGWRPMRRATQRGPPRPRPGSADCSPPSPSTPRGISRRRWPPSTAPSRCSACIPMRPPTTRAPSPEPGRATSPGSSGMRGLYRRPLQR